MESLKSSPLPNVCPFHCAAPLALISTLLLYPDLTVGPIFCRSFGPNNVYQETFLSFETASLLPPFSFTCYKKQDSMRNAKPKEAASCRTPYYWLVDARMQVDEHHTK
jgi:hypothetical protein